MSLAIEDLIASLLVGSPEQNLERATRMVPVGLHCLEFGVRDGISLRSLCARLPRVFGFDSFAGLPEAWDKEAGRVFAPAGYYGVDYRSKAWPENAELVVGWFAETIPQWLAAYDGAVGFLHVDCDIFSSARDVLTLLNDRIVPGTVIVFDEIYPFCGGYPNWAAHEWKALTEWLADYRREVSPLFHSNSESATVMVTT